MTKPTPNGAALHWHRTLGIAAAVFVLFLSVTGVLLNHGGQLGLDRHTTDSPWLLDWYGLAHNSEIVSYQAGGHWISWSDRHLFLDGRAVAEHAANLRGAALSDGLIAAATPDEIFLLTPEGDLVERLNGASLPGHAKRVGLDPDKGFVIGTAHANFRATKDFSVWSETGAEVRWAEPVPTPAEIQQKVLVDYRGAGLPWSRVMLDVHSGRILGRWGPFVMDAAAIALIVLALTGLVNWSRRKR
ncbi:MAG: PepSY domain-containing protein [Rhodospirillales bacterium]|nr:PepSY domain-containing protein [Rhodospirillales bacterium]